MKSVRPYLIFSGKCAEALRFYRDCFDGEIALMQTFADSPMDVADEHKQRVFNSEFRANGLDFMASDSVPPYEIEVGSNFAMLVNFSEFEELEMVFGKLSKDGKIVMPLDNSDSGSRFGMIADKYGIQWMLTSQT